MFCDQAFLTENVSSSAHGYLRKLSSLLYLGCLSKDNKRLPGKYLEQLAVVPTLNQIPSDFGYTQIIKYFNKQRFLFKNWIIQQYKAWRW